MMALKFLSLDNRAEWSRLVESLPAARRDLHFLPEYGEIYRQVYGFEPLLAHFDAGDRGCVIQPFVKRPLAELPFLKERQSPPTNEIEFDLANPYGFGGPLVSGEPSLLGEFENEILQSTAHLPWATEFCSLHPLLEIVEPLREANVVELHPQKWVAVIPLAKPLEELWRGFDKGHKSSIKKAQKLGVRVDQVSPSPENLQIFRDLYDQTMLRRNAAQRWRFPVSFFSQTLTCLGEDRVSLFFASVERQVVAAYFLIHGYETAYLHFSGADQAYLKFCPNNLLMFETLRWAQERGYKHYHLGGGVSESPSDPLFSFKAGFSADKVMLYTYYRILNEATYERLCQLKREHEVRTQGAELSSTFFPLYRR